MTPPATPLRIQRLSLTDFRAFPGPERAPFDLDGGNLLVFGENGTGKSSLYHALKEFFSIRPRHTLPYYRNVFSGAPEGCVCVEVGFNDGGAAARWFLSATSGAVGAAPLGSQAVGGGGTLIERHPAQTGGGSDQRVTQAALRRGCLDYRALLDTNYKHGDEPVDLFELAVHHLVADYSVAVTGGTTRTISELWRTVELAKPARQTSSAVAKVNQACADFNAGFNQALLALHPHISTLLTELIGGDVVVAPFSFSGLTYTPAHYKRDRKISGGTLTLDVSFRNHQLAIPQHFLNEARLSALALAIYFAGRLACTPSGASGNLKLLVLDDVLIGLDHSNRLPVLDLLRAHFDDWQVVMLTHDRIWFEMARFHLGATGKWKCIEVLDSIDPIRGPTVRGAGDRPGKAILEQAEEFLKSHHVPAAANYTRAAFEWALKSFCERFKVPVPFSTDPRHVNTEALLSSVERWMKGHGSTRLFAGVIERVKLFRKIVLNPYSHASPPSIARAEVEGAIGAVGAMVKLFDPVTTPTDSLFASARQLVSNAAPNQDELHAALGYLRAGVSASISGYCKRKHVVLASADQVQPTKILWAAAKADATHPVPVGIAGKIDAGHAALLIDDVTDAVLASLSKASIEAAMNACCLTGDPNKFELDDA